jgi:hypothetical protein
VHVNVAHGDEHFNYNLLSFSRVSRHRGIFPQVNHSNASKQTTFLTHTYSELFLSRFCEMHLTKEFDLGAVEMHPRYRVLRAGPSGAAKTSISSSDRYKIHS